MRPRKPKLVSSSRLSCLSRWEVQVKVNLTKSEQAREGLSKMFNN